MRVIARKFGLCGLFLVLAIISAIAYLSHGQSDAAAIGLAVCLILAIVSLIV